MVNFKKSYIVFKIRDMTKPRNKGARCDQGSKTGAIKNLNTIVGEALFTPRKQNQFREPKYVLLLNYY